MQRDRGKQKIRAYIILVGIIRTLVVVLAGVRGFSMYFPRVEADHSLMFSIIVLITFWFIAIFFNSIRPIFIWIAFLLDGLMAYFCGLGIYRQYKTMTIYEAIYFGNSITIIIDILLIIYLVNKQYSQQKRDYLN